MDLTPRPDRRSTLLLALALLGALACVSSPPPVAPVPAPAPAEPVVEEPEYSNTLRWTTASEVDNFGFDVYRGDSEDGPFERLTENPISGAGTTDLTTKYSFVDTAIDPARPYFYYVESISLQGVREQFTPIIKAKAKIGGDEEETAEGDAEGDAESADG